MMEIITICILVYLAGFALLYRFLYWAISDRDEEAFFACSVFWPVTMPVFLITFILFWVAELAKWGIK